jgi:hypothetical protein
MIDFISDCWRITRLHECSAKHVICDMRNIITRKRKHAMFVNIGGKWINSEMSVSRQLGMRLYAEILAAKIEGRLKED